MAGADSGQVAQTIIRPQAGPQTTFLASPADIAIYGGSAGGGKTWALLMEPLRHVANPLFGAVFFRRTTVQVRNEGGLWDESEKLYPLMGAQPKEHNLQWKFPSGSALSFAHLEHDKTVLNWQGSQIPLLCFDELTHFSAKQFWYMVSRNRSMSGVRGYTVTASDNSGSGGKCFGDLHLSNKVCARSPDVHFAVHCPLRKGFVHHANGSGFLLGAKVMGEP